MNEWNEWMNGMDGMGSNTIEYNRIG